VYVPYSRFGYPGNLVINQEGLSMVKLNVSNNKTVKLRVADKLCVIL
jgi:hypothetical protein